MPSQEEVMCSKYHKRHPQKVIICQEQIRRNRNANTLECRSIFVVFRFPSKFIVDCLFAVHIETLLLNIYIFVGFTSKSRKSPRIHQRDCIVQRTYSNI